MWKTNTRRKLLGSYIYLITFTDHSSYYRADTPLGYVRIKESFGLWVARWDPFNTNVAPPIEVCREVSFEACLEQTRKRMNKILRRAKALQ